MLTAAQIIAVKRALSMNSAAEANYPHVDVVWSANRVLATLPPETEAAVVEVLVRLDNIDAALDSARGRLKATTVSTISLNGAELDQLWRERRRWARELSTLTGLPIVGAGATMVVV